MQGLIHNIRYILRFLKYCLSLVKCQHKNKLNYFTEFTQSKFKKNNDHFRLLSGLNNMLVYQIIKVFNTSAIFQKYYGQD